MSYHLQENEKLPQGIKRFDFEQIDQALNHLQSPDDDLDEAVPESRKCFKILHGLLRLMRKETCGVTYSHACGWLCRSPDRFRTSACV
jgi:hypothetical protein